MMPRIHGRTSFTRRCAPPREIFKRAPGPTAKTAKTPGRFARQPVARLGVRPGYDRMWCRTPCKKQDRGGFFGLTAARVKTLAKGRQETPNGA